MLFDTHRRHLRASEQLEVLAQTDQRQPSILDLFVEVVGNGKRLILGSGDVERFDNEDSR